MILFSCHELHGVIMTTYALQLNVILHAYVPLCSQFNNPDLRGSTSRRGKPFFGALALWQETLGWRPAHSEQMWQNLHLSPYLQAPLLKSQQIPFLPLGISSSRPKVGSSTRRFQRGCTVGHSSVSCVAVQWVHSNLFLARHVNIWLQMCMSIWDHFRLPVAAALSRKASSYRRHAGSLYSRWAHNTINM